MTVRHVSRRRRLTAWLAAALIGATAALTVVTPARAAITCTLTFKAHYWPTLDGSHRWHVKGSLMNTGTRTSTTWAALIRFSVSSGTVVKDYWNIERPVPRRSVWKPVSWNAAVAPGAQTYFGFDIRTPSADVSPLPIASLCTITY